MNPPKLLTTYTLILFERIEKFRYGAELIPGYVTIYTLFGRKIWTSKWKSL